MNKIEQIKKEILEIKANNKEMFIENKYYKWYFNIIENAKIDRENRKEGYYEWHHIIPRCFDGSEDDSNYAKLTAKEHFIVHHIIPKFVFGKFKYKMLKAHNLMASKYEENKIIKITSRTFSHIKSELYKIKLAKFKKVIIWCNEKGYLPNSNSKDKKELNYKAFINYVCSHAEGYDSYMASEFEKFPTYLKYNQKLNIENLSKWIKIHGYKPSDVSEDKEEVDLAHSMWNIVHTPSDYYTKEFVDELLSYPSKKEYLRKIYLNNALEWCKTNGYIPDRSSFDNIESKYGIIIKSHLDYRRKNLPENIELTKKFEEFPSKSSYKYKNDSADILYRESLGWCNKHKCLPNSKSFSKKELELYNFIQKLKIDNNNLYLNFANFVEYQDPCITNTSKMIISIDNVINWINTHKFKFLNIDRTYTELNYLPTRKHKPKDIDDIYQSKCYGKMAKYIDSHPEDDKLVLFFNQFNTLNQLKFKQKLNEYIKYLRDTKSHPKDGHFLHRVYKNHFTPLDKQLINDEIINQNICII